MSRTEPGWRAGLAAMVLLLPTLTMSACVSPYSPTTDRNLSTTQSYVLNPAAPWSDLARNLLAVIDALNTGDRDKAMGLTCGLMQKQITDKTAADFAQAQKAQLDQRGRGALVSMTDQTATPDQMSVTALATVRYDKAAPGMQPDNTITYRALWKKVGDSWRLCNLLGGA